MSHLVEAKPPIVLRCRASGVSYNKKRSVHTNGDGTNPNSLCLPFANHPVPTGGTALYAPLHRCLE